MAFYRVEVRRRDWFWDWHLICACNGIPYSKYGRALTKWGATRKAFKVWNKIVKPPGTWETVSEKMNIPEPIKGV